MAEALAAGAALEGLYVDEEAAAEAADIVAEAMRQSVAVHSVAAGVLVGITDTVTPRGLLAVAPMPDHRVETVIAGALADARPLLVLIDVRDPGNVGTIIRAADASGVAGVLCSAGTADPWSPKVVRSSAGTVLNVPICTGLEGAELLDCLSERNVPTVATVVVGGVAYDQAELAGTVGLVMGNEASGLATPVVERLDQKVTIPMEGRAESLNVAMAASVLCFEAARQRRDRHRPRPGDAQTDWTSPPTDDKVNTP